MTKHGFDTLRTANFVLLTTFRKSGEGVPTAVWAAPAGEALMVTTMSTAGKVKRIRNNSAVTLSECSMSGNVKDGAEMFAGTAEIVEDPARIEEYNRALAAKYGIQFSAANALERLRKVPRVILRITPA